MTREVFGYHFRSIMEQFEGKVRTGLKEGRSMVTAYLWLVDEVDSLITTAGWTRGEFDRWAMWDKEVELLRKVGPDGER